MRISAWSSDVCSSDRNTLKALQLEPVELACGEAERFQVTADAVEQLEPAPDGLIVASPANPTGTIIPPDELQALAEVCERRGIALVSDEIYHGLSYTLPAETMLKHAPDALVVNSFSKYFSMARSEEHTSELQSLMRISYAVF